MARGTPGLDGCELLTPTNRLLVFFLVEVGLCEEAVAGSPAADILVWLMIDGWRGRRGHNSHHSRSRTTPVLLAPRRVTTDAPSPWHTFTMTSRYRYHPDRVDGRCAMRGSCGSKGLFGKPLPCPYDGPPYEVWRHSIYPRSTTLVVDDALSQMIRLYPC